MQAPSFCNPGFCWPSQSLLGGCERHGIPILQPQTWGAVTWLPAAEVETVIANAIRTQLQIKPDVTPDRELISGHVARINLLQAQLKVTLYAGPERYGLQDSNAPTGSVKRRREIVLPLSTRPGAEQRPICADTRTKLVCAMAKGALAIDALPECVDRIRAMVDGCDRYLGDGSGAEFSRTLI